MAQLEQEYDLTGPIWYQYGQYLWKVAHGNLSISTQYRDRTVSEIIAQSLPVSMTLGSIAYLMALVGGITVGGWAAIRHNQWGDRSLMLLALLGISIPSFILAPLLIMLFALKLNILPAYGWGSPDQIILPALCLSIPFAASIARLTRGSLLEVLKLDFIRTARAKASRKTPCFFATRSRSRSCRSSATTALLLPAF